MQNSVPASHPAKADIFDSIRNGFADVARVARHVRIREDRLVEYALSLQHRPPSNTLDDMHHYTSTDPEALATCVLSLDAVNFGSGYFPRLVAEGWQTIDNSIYYTVSTALKNCFDACGPWSAVALRQLPVQNVQAIFGFPDAPYGRAMTALFTSALNEMGAFIADEYDGRFMGLVDDSQGQAARLVSRLAGLQGFQDIHDYHGRSIPIYKRAQHVAASLHESFSRIGRPLFGDITRLTMFADNAVPHVLRCDGVLEYAPALASRIDSGTYLAPGSDEEIEIRCCAGNAVERIAAIKSMPAVDLDYILWHRSEEDPRYRVTAPHLALTSNY